MPTTTTNPTAVGFYNDFSLSAGASKVAAVSLPDDDDATHIESGTANEKQTFAMENIPSSAGSVSQVQQRGRMRRGGTGTSAKLMIRVGGVDTFGASFQVESSFENRLETLAPSGGWDPDKWNGAEVGVEHQSTVANLRVTTISADVTWLPKAAGWKWIVGLWLPGIIGFHAVTRAELQAFFRGFQTRPSNREDFCRILEGMRVRPRFAL